MENEKTLVALLKTPDGREADLTEFLADYPAFIIGTDTRSSLRLMGVGVEPAHAIITHRDDGYYIAPRVPAAKVFVNGQLVTKPTRLNAGDTLQLGAVSLTVAQSEAVALLAPIVVLQPAVLPSFLTKEPQFSQSRNRAVATAAAPISSVPTARQIYFPKEEVSRGMSVPALISGIVAILAVAFVIGYGFVASPTAAADITSQYAFKDGHVTVVMFEASWCHFCKQQKPILTSLANEFRGKVYNQFLDAEASVNSAMVKAFNVDAYPVTVIFNDQGHVVAKFLGLTDAGSIRAAINQALKESVGTVSPAA